VPGVGPSGPETHADCRKETALQGSDLLTGVGGIAAYIGGLIADSLGYTVLFTIFGTLFLLSAFALSGIKEGESKCQKAAVRA
jgi:hypothetical protein